MGAFDDEFGPAAERPPDALRRIVRYQRWLITVVLAQLVLWGGFIAVMALSRGRGASVQFPVVLTFILGAVGGVFVFLLAWELRGPFAAVVFGLATVFPCLGLLILTLVNGYATTELRKHGIPVGIFGASTDAISDRPSLYDDEDAGW